MHNSIVLKAVLPLLIMMFAVSAQAGTVTLTDTITQSNWAGYLDSKGTIGTFDFTGDAGLASLTSISDIKIRMWIFQGDTAPGDFDYMELTLVLDGTDSGVELNGFSAGSLVEQTNSGAPSGASSILSDLQSDGQLFAEVLDHSANDNWIRIVGSGTATLTITGSDDNVGQPIAYAPIPQAAPLGLVLMGGLGLLGWMRRRRREF